MTNIILFEATHLRDNRWAVRPAGCLGTCGWIQGVAWTVDYITATSAESALRKAEERRWRNAERSTAQHRSQS